MLAVLEGGCLAPIGAWARIENDLLTLTGRVLSLDGRTRLDATLTGDPEEPEALARRVAQELLNQGAGDLIRAAHKDG
jgi:hydroxymethylbilane synthase